MEVFPGNGTISDYDKPAIWDNNSELSVTRVLKPLEDAEGNKGALWLRITTIKHNAIVRTLGTNCILTT